MNNINKKLFDAIKNQLTNFSLKELKAINLTLSKKYKQKKHKYFDSDKERLAYIAARMPATFSALTHVLDEIKITFPDLSLKSVLDLGSGPATAVWAVFDVFKNIEKVHPVDKDRIIYLGESLLAKESFFEKIFFEQNDILKIKNYDYDMVCLSYVAAELKRPFIDRIIKRWFFSPSKIIVFLEPGTVRGFKNIKYIRQLLIKLGSKIIAPCSHELKCPMPQNDWCHFYVRVQRSKHHKYLKQGTLSYEDEKFSYVVATKMNVEKKYSRVLRRPLKKADEISIMACAQGKIKNEAIREKDNKRYKAYKKIYWGDRINV